VDTLREIKWHQRSKIRWATVRDMNTKLFHNAATQRWRRNRITTLQRENGIWTVEEAETRSLLVNYFKMLYVEGVPQAETEVLMVNSIPLLPSIQPETHSSLTQIPSCVEVYRTLCTIELDRAPRPDGITARLLKEQWDIFGPTIVGTIQEAFRSGEVPEQWMHSHIVLIPKTEHPSQPTHFRPLSVCSIYYRLLMKVIANRVKPTLDALVLTTQMAFLKGRSIQDSVLLVGEVMQSFQDQNITEEAFMLKADLFKAFDTLNWTFLHCVLVRFGFPTTLVTLIMMCVSSSRFTIKLNRGAGGSFISPKRGLR
jgi:Reverse transcriptase (RNA-dependent DNA polymerase)